MMIQGNILKRALSNAECESKKKILAAPGWVGAASKVWEV
jgi:hypothetical protein